MSTTADSCVARGWRCVEIIVRLPARPASPTRKPITGACRPRSRWPVPGPRERARVGSSSPPDQPVERETSSP
jgi:hypothetical protein